MPQDLVKTYFALFYIWKHQNLSSIRIAAILILFTLNAYRLNKYKYSWTFVSKVKMLSYFRPWDLHTPNLSVKHSVEYPKQIWKVYRLYQYTGWWVDDSLKSTYTFTWDLFKMQIWMCQVKLKELVWMRLPLSLCLTQDLTH